MLAQDAPKTPSKQPKTPPTRPSYCSNLPGKLSNCKTNVQTILYITKLGSKIIKLSFNSNLKTSCHLPPYYSLELNLISSTSDFGQKLHSKLNLGSFFLNSWISICRNTMSKILINLIFCNLKNSWNLLITKSRDHQNRISGPALIFIDTPKLSLGKIFINFWISIWRNTMNKILVNFDFRNLENF